MQWRLKITEKRNQWKHWKMGGYPMLMDWQNQYCESGCTVKSNLYVQCNPYQNSNNSLHQDRKISPKVHIEAHKTSNSQSNPEPKQQCWKYHNSWLQTILQTYNNKSSMARAQNRHERQWNRIESPDTNPHNYSHLIFDRGVPNIYIREDSLFNKCCWVSWSSTFRRLKLDTSLSTLYQQQFKVN
jgi:hypothetical protein